MKMYNYKDGSLGIDYEGLNGLQRLLLTPSEVEELRRELVPKEQTTTMSFTPDEQSIIDGARRDESVGTFLWEYEKLILKMVRALAAKS